MDFLVQAIGIIFAGIIQGVTGFGTGFVAVGVLTIYQPASVVIPSLAMVYMITNSIILYEHRKYLKKKN